MQQIRNLSRPDLWRHVRGDINPADEASRGLLAKRVVNDFQMDFSPECLWQNEVSSGCQIYLCLILR